MKIITGGAGFIGSAICWRLNQLGFDDILIVDTDKHGSKANNLKPLTYNGFISKDEFILQLNEKNFNEKVTAIYHMGACSSTTEQNMEYLLENNTEYSKKLALWCLENKARFIYASSGATYGNGNEGFSDEHSAISHLKPINKYGLSKHLFDLWVLEQKIENKIVGLKYFNVYGPNESHKGEMRSMVNKAYSKIKDTGKMELFKSYLPGYKDGEQMRDFIYIKDAVEMTLFFDLDENGKTSNGIFNIGTGKARKWIDMANSLFSAMDREPNIEFVEMPDNIRNQYQYFTEAKIDKLIQCGYKKNISSLEDGVYDYVVNYLDKEKFLAP